MPERRDRESGAQQLDMGLGPELLRETYADTAELRRALAPAIPTAAFSTYWRFAVERQRIFYRRLLGTPGPWTSDPILSRHKFTNAYRASDRVSQYLIRHVIYGDDVDVPPCAEDTVFRILLFKLFNKIETWERLRKALGEINWRSFDVARYAEVLDAAMERGERLYSAAYIMPAAPRPEGETRKHRSHLYLIEHMMRDGIVLKLGRARSMQEGFRVMRSYPSLGDFLAYQFITDLNYAELLSFSEMEFVVPGPGARDGIAKCFVSLGGLSESEVIRYMADIQADMFRAHGLTFPSLWGRMLQLIDCQNLFCEVDKYSRVFHPDIQGRTGRKRIKQQFQPAADVLPAWYPPKWGINERIAAREVPDGLTDAEGVYGDIVL